VLLDRRNQLPDRVGRRPARIVVSTMRSIETRHCKELVALFIFFWETDYSLASRALNGGPQRRINQWLNGFTGYPPTPPPDQVAAWFPAQPPRLGLYPPVSIPDGMDGTPPVPEAMVSFVGDIVNVFQAAPDAADARAGEQSTALASLFSLAWLSAAIALAIAVVAALFTAWSSAMVNRRESSPDAYSTSGHRLRVTYGSLQCTPHDNE